MPTTTNYGWTTPADTDLVKDGAAAIRTLGSSIDTSVKSLNAGTTAGDIDYYTSSTAKARVGIGSSGQVLTVSGGVPAWATPSDQTPLTTKGDLFTFTTTDARLGVGTNGQVLAADSAEATGLKWTTPASGGMTLISTVSSSGTGTIAFSSIPSTYKHLYIVARDLTMSTSNEMTMRMNGDTGGTSYGHSCVRMTATYSNYSQSAGAAQMTVVPLLPTNNGKTYFTQFEMSIPRYTDTNSNQIVNAQGWQSGRSMFLFTGNYYERAAAINSFSFDTSGGTFTGGTVYLYGVN